MAKLGKNLSLETLDKQQEKIISLLHEEQNRAREKFPLVYALLATLGVACVITGLNRIVARFDFLNNNPVAMVLFGLGLLLLTGAAYKKLG